MTELNNDRLKEVAGGTGSGNSSFQIGDWVAPKKTRISPSGMRQYFRIDDIVDPDSSMPSYIVNVYTRNPIDGSITKISELGSFLADELKYGHDPTPFDDLQ